MMVLQKKFLVTGVEIFFYETVFNLMQSAEGQKLDDFPYEHTTVGLADGAEHGSVYQNLV